MIIQSTDINHVKELLYWSVLTGKQMNVFKARDVLWHTQACTVGWSVQVC